MCAWCYSSSIRKLSMVRGSQATANKYRRPQVVVHFVFAVIWSLRLLCVELPPTTWAAAKFQKSAKIFPEGQEGTVNALLLS